MSFKVCIIGCGDIANAAHGPAMKKYVQNHSGVSLTACCDSSLQRADAFKTRFGFTRSYTDYREMILKEQPNAVLVLVPVHLSAEIAAEVMKLGIPVMMEKPPGMNENEALKIIKTAKDTKVPNAIAFNRRHMPLVKKLKELLDGVEIQSVDCEFFRVNRTDPDFSTTAIHGIDTVRYIAGGDYEKVAFDYHDLPQYGKNVANISMRSVFSTGVHSIINFMPMTGAVMERITVHARDNIYFLKMPVWGGLDYVNGFDAPGNLVRISHDKVIMNLNGDEMSGGNEGFIANGFYDEDMTFIEDIKNGRPPKFAIESGLDAVRIASCIRDRKKLYFSESYF